MAFFFSKSTVNPLSLATPLVAIDAETGVSPAVTGGNITSITNQTGGYLHGNYKTGVPYRGINRAGAEFGNIWGSPIDGWTGQTYYDIPDAVTWAAELAYLALKGFNYIRIPFSWERTQHTLNGPLNTSYWSAYTAMVLQATTAGFKVVVDLHCYGRYAIGAFTGDQLSTQTTTYTQHILGDGTLTFAHVADVWTKIASTFASYPATLISYNLMNEPHDHPMTSTVFFAGIQTVMNAIRTVDTIHTINVPNTRGSDIQHWDLYSPGDLVLGAGLGGPLDSVAALAITDINFTFDMHAHYESSTTEWGTSLTNVTNWAVTNGRRLVMTEMGIHNDNPTGATLVAGILGALNANSVWEGWATWNLPPQNLTLAGSYVTDGTEMPWYTPYLTSNTVANNTPPLQGFGGSNPVWLGSDEKAGSLHSIRFTPGQRLYLGTAVNFSAGASLFATVKTTSADSVSTQAVNAPMTVFGYNATPAIWSAGLSAGTAQYKYGSGSGGVVSSVPTNPYTITVKETRLLFNSGLVDYYVYIPNGYDSTHNTPMKLFTWLHGCDGYSMYDIVYAATRGPSSVFGVTGTEQDYITMCPTGTGSEGACWFSTDTYATQETNILSCITDIKKRFNIDAGGCFLGGYSSGGDVGYPLLFRNSNLFAGGLFCNTSPRGDGSGINGILAGQNATNKGHIFHITHSLDNSDGGNYSTATVTADMTTLTTAGWTTTVLEKPGNHWENGAGNPTGDSAIARTTTGSTTYDILNFLLPHIDDGWTSPGTAPSTTTSYNSNKTNLNDGDNHTICWTHSTAGVLSVYVDGVLDNSWSGITYNTGALLNIIGGGYLDTDNFDGSIAEAFSYSGVLTDQNVRDLHSRSTQKW